MKKKYRFLIFILISGMLCFILSGCQVKPNSQTIYTSDGYALNTYVSVSLYGCGSQEIADKAVGLCEYYEKIFSRTDEESLLSRLNSSGYMSPDTTEDEQTDPDESEYTALFELVCAGLEYGKITEGALDITIEPLSSLWNFSGGRQNPPDDSDISEAVGKTDYNQVELTDNGVELNGTRIDLGAIAKGYIADAICEYLVGEGVDSALVNLGGNVECVGRKPDGSKFTIGIQKPFDENGGVIRTLKIDDMSVVTSGVYERYFYDGDDFYHHILNPETGYPCDNGLLSVTIISDSSLQCDCLSTGCFVMGMDKAMELVDSMEGVYAIFVDEDYKVFYSRGAEKYVSE